MARVASDTFLLGQHGELHAGDEIPDTFADLAGTHQTDFERLEALGLVEPVEPVKQPRKPAAKTEA